MKVPPPGDRIPCTMPTTDIKDEEPKDEEIRPVVVAANDGKSKGIDMVQAENIKIWLWKMTVEEEYEADAQREEEETGIPRDSTKPIKGAGWGDQWRKFVEIIQSIWRMRIISRHLLRVIVVLIPKGNSGDFCGIGLMQTMWKIVEGVLERRLHTLELHKSLHGGLKSKGTGTAIMEMKLAQGLAQLGQMPMWATFIDLWKAFDAMARERLLEILEDRGVGPNLLPLIRVFWEMAIFCCRAGGNHGRSFKAFRGVTQGGPLSPRLFNIMVDAIVRE